MALSISIVCWIVTCFSRSLLGEKPTRQWTAHHAIERRGWTIHVDTRLLEPANNALGRRAINLLTGKLLQISIALPQNRLKQLRGVTFFLDLNHGQRITQYYPDSKWLRQHDYDPAMARSIHIPNAAKFVRLIEGDRQPWVMMHELAHAFHDQQIGFDAPRVMSAFKRSVDAGQLDKTPHISGKRMRHYALVDHKEFFAEMTEAYLGSNDFFPFNRSQLSEFDPKTYQLIRELWSTAQ